MYSRDLVSAVAIVSGLPAETVEQHYRRLHAKDLITKGGRGRSAAHMKPRDATRVLFSVALSPSPAMGADRVTIYEDLAVMLRAKRDMEALDLDPHSRLFDAIEALAMPYAEHGALVIQANTCSAQIALRKDTFKADLPFMIHADDMSRLKGARVDSMIDRTSTVPLGVFGALYKAL